MLTILNFFYSVVLLSYGAEFARAQIKKQRNDYALLLCLFSLVFLDSFIFELCFWHTYTPVLNNNCLFDALFTVGTAMIYMQVSHRKSGEKNLIIFIGDSLNLCLTIINGAERALFFENDYALAVFSALCSALWDEIVISILAGDPIVKTMLSNQCYHITVIAETLIYALLLQNGIDRTYAQGLIALSSLFFTMICNTFSTKGNTNSRKKAHYIKRQYMVHVNLDHKSTISNLYNYNRHFCYKLTDATVPPTRPPFLNKTRKHLYHRLHLM